MTETRIQIATVLWNGEPCLFREPRRPDARNASAEARLKRDFPGIKKWHTAITILSACYIPDADERGIDTLRELAEAASEDEENIARLLFGFRDAFPASPMWE